MKSTDPVCGMEIDANAESPAQVHEGRRYYFCSAQCRTAFVADPGKYASAGSSGQQGGTGSGHHGEHSESGGHGCCR